MKIINEYKIMSDCVERGVEYGYMRAYKHNDSPSEDFIKNEIMEHIMNEISEMFSFDKDEAV